MANELEKNVEAQESAENATAPDDTRVKALEAEIAKLRQAVTNASADASKYKKELQARQTDEERAKAEQAEANAALQQELEDLRRERNLANYTAELSRADIGMDADTARAVAEALNSGDTKGVFDGIRKFIATHDKQLRENAFRSNPVLQGGSTAKAITKEQFDKMGYKDRVRVFEEHPDLYREFTS